MSSRRWMPLYVADYLADTMHLNTLQHGAYLLLILEYWQKGQLPADDDPKIFEKNLQKICRLSSYRWKQNRSALAALFGPNWQHKRIERELKKANDLNLKRTVYGSMAGGNGHGRKRNARGVAVHERN
jgi:uncharacterized protein YdaU (DUF1376 family)